MIQNKLHQKGYSYINHISTGGEGEVHLIKKDDIFYIAKIFDKLDENSINLLNHIKKIEAPNVPKIMEVFNHNEKTILIRDYIDGHTLYDEIAEKEKLPLERAKFITIKICETLATFHELKPNPIIYRDLKPENIMISKMDEVFLIDFGIARYHKEEVTRDTVLAGTKGYTAPEIMAGMQSDKRSDIYSVGLIFYEMLTGNNLLMPPFQIRPVRESDESLPAWIDEIIEKSTGISMVSRYKDIDEFVSSIKNPKKFKINKRVFMIAGTVAVLFISVMIGIRLYKNMTDQDSVQVDQSEVESTESYNVVIDLQFDDKSDADWFDFLGENVESIVEEDCIENGVFTLKGEIQLKQALQPGKFAHFRVTTPDVSHIDEEGPVFMVDLKDTNYNESTAFQFFRFCFQNKIPLSLSVNKLNEFTNVYQSDTSMMFRSRMTVDVIVWLDEQDNSLRYIILDTENQDELCYLGLTIDDSLLNNIWMVNLFLPYDFWGGALSEQELYTDIEFMRLASGSLEKYLSENVPSYTHNRDAIDTFLSKPVSHMNDLYYMGYDE